MRGHVAELLTKAIDRGALDREVKAEDKARLLGFLSVYGDHTSMLVSWQEGAALSAHRAVGQIGRRVA